MNAEFYQTHQDIISEIDEKNFTDAEKKELRLISNLEYAIDDMFKAGCTKKMVMANVKANINHRWSKK